MSGEKDRRGGRGGPYARRGTVCCPLSAEVRAAIADCTRRVAPEWVARQEERDGPGSHHLTAITAAELNRMEGGVKEVAARLAHALGEDEEGQSIRMAPLGLGTVDGECAFLAVHCSALESARRSLGLKPCRQFHVTLGFKERDVHSGEKKGPASVVDWWPRAGEAIEADFQTIRSLEKGHQRDLLKGVLEACVAGAFHVTALKAALLLGDALASGSAFDGLSLDDPVEAHFIKAKYEIGAGIGGSEVAHMALRHLEGAPAAPDDARIAWLSKEARAASLSEGCSVWSSAGGSVQLIRMPLNSVPLSGVAGSAELWGSGCPSEKSAKALSALGFTRVVTLMEEPLHASVLHVLGDRCSVWHRPMPDRSTPPTVRELVETARTVQRGMGPRRGPVLVHCLGGRGRTALVLAAILMLENSARGPSEALARVRGGGRLVRMTHPQVAMLKELFAVLAAGPGHAPSQRTVNVRLLPRLVVLCGRPGAGKSTFAMALVRRLPPGAVVHVNQDELGKSEADAAWAQHAGQGGSPGSVVVLDNCCPTRAHRRYALELCNGHTPVLVHFAADASACAARAGGRGDDHVGGVHGTGAARIVERVDKLFETPSPDEGFKSIVSLVDDAAAEALLSSWGCGSSQEDDSNSSCGLVSKFPRTTHLVDLGSATRDDLRVPDPAEWLAASPPGVHEDTVIVEEKVDGANLGFRRDVTGNIVAQNRSHFVNSASHAQFKKLGAFADAHGNSLRDAVLRDEHLVLYGEWLHAKHSVGYDALPGSLFVAFDLRCLLTDTWASRSELQQVLSATSIPLTPLLLHAPKGSVSLQRDILPLVHRNSSFATDASAEGVYVRMEADGLVKRRAKIVRPNFIAGDAHWKAGPPKENTLRPANTHMQ